MLRLLPCAALLASPTLSQTADYRVLDQHRGSRVELASFPVRPMASVPEKGARPARVWAVNTHEDLLEGFPRILRDDSSKITPTITVPTAWDPVAVAYWAGIKGDDELLVACRGSYGLMRLDADDGAPLGFITLLQGDLGGATDARGHGAMAEPSDVLVDPATDMAFVTCTGADTVVQIDLRQGQVVRRFHGVESPTGDDFRLKSPVFLSFDPVTVAGQPRRVLVAPLHSGNGTTVNTNSVVAGPARIDLASTFDDAGVPLNDLPDQDLFRIRPWTGAFAGDVAPITSGSGTILFAHGAHPATGDHWQLNTEAHNGGPANASEPLVKGRFATNRLTITSGLGTPAEAKQFVSLEEADWGATTAGDQGVGQPFALSFGSSGRAYLAGLLSDNVAALTPSGALLYEWDLPPASIPRGLLPVTQNGREHLLVHCWGTNTIERYVTSPTAQPVHVATVLLKADGTPPRVRRGRSLFFDGSRSATGTLSCATCHVEGGFDGLAWDLSPQPFHSKRPMVTQTLVGIEKLGPFHWRGERDFLDFNPAFDGLLGNVDPVHGNQLSGPEFAQFQAYVFSLRNPANPHQNRRRVVDTALHRPAGNGLGDAVLGQDLFHDVDTLGDNTCVDCHSAPTGTAGDIFPIFGAVREPVRTNLMPTALHELWRKEQPVVSLSASGAGDRALLGFGFSHGGGEVDLEDFHDFAPAAFLEHIVDFTFQWDQGIAPAAHFGFTIDAASAADTGPNGALAQGRSYLEREAGPTHLNCDVVLHGMTNVGGSLRLRSWWFDRSLPAPRRYRCNDSTLGPRAFTDFVNGAISDGERHVIHGYPLGSGERLSIDRDLDGVVDLDEQRAGTNPRNPNDPGTPLTSPPTFVRQPQVLWGNVKHTRIDLETDQPTKLFLDVRESGTTAWTRMPADGYLSRLHTPLARGLRGSTTRHSSAPASLLPLDEPLSYDYRVTVRNRSGLSTSFTISNAPAAPMIVHDQFLDPTPPNNQSDELLHTAHVIGSSAVTQPTPGTFEAEIQTRFKRGAPGAVARPENRIVVGRLLKESPAGSGSGVVPIDPATITAGAGTLFTPGLDVFSGSSGAVTLATAPDVLVALVPSDPSGMVRVQWSLAPGAVAPGDRLFFNVDAIIEVEGPGWFTPGAGGNNPLVEMNFNRGLAQWSFPDTGEALTAPFMDIP